MYGYYAKKFISLAKDISSRVRPHSFSRVLCAHSTAVRPSQAFSNVVGSDYVVRSPFPDIEVPTENLYSLITKNFSKYGSKIALVNGLSRREYSYMELNELTCRFSSGLQRIGFRRGDTLGIVAPNSPEYAVTFLGTLAAGGVISTCNHTYTADELAYQFQNSGTKIIVTIPDILSTVQEASSKANIEKIIVLDDSYPTSSNDNLVSFQSLVSDSGSLFNPVQTEPDEVIVLPYSSGTTGLAKGVMLTNSSVGSNILQLIDPEIFQLKEDYDCLIGILPFFHIYGMVVTLFSSLYAGTKLITLPKFEPESFLSTIEKYRVNIAHLVPPLIVFLAKHPLVDRYDVSSITQIMSGAAPLGGDIVVAASERVKCKCIRQGYGLTETSPVTHIVPRSLSSEIPSSIGHCIRSVKTKIVNPDNGEVLPPNKEGEVCIYGPNVMKGYLNNPEATRGCISKDGWFASGDIGELS